MVGRGKVWWYCVIVPKALEAVAQKTAHCATGRLCKSQSIDYLSKGR